MKKIAWKRNAAVAAMLVLVGAAVFVNWKYTNNSAVETGTKILGESTLVSGGEDAAAGSAGAADESGVYEGTDYFASARLTRQQARDSAISLLQQAADEEGAAPDVADEASKGIQALAAYTLTESQIENLVTAKGYKDCVTFMGNDSVSVVVSTESGELSDTDVAKITDIAVNETGYPASTVKIMAAN
jgi:stage III sporulation protein AH